MGESANPKNVIELDHISKTYGDFVAVQAKKQVRIACNERVIVGRLQVKAIPVAWQGMQQRCFPRLPRPKKGHAGEHFEILTQQTLVYPLHTMQNKGQPLKMQAKSNTFSRQIDPGRGRSPVWGEPSSASDPLLQVIQSVPPGQIPHDPVGYGAMKLPHRLMDVWSALRQAPFGKLRIYDGGACGAEAFRQGPVNSS